MLKKSLNYLVKGRYLKVLYSSDGDLAKLELDVNGISFRDIFLDRYRKGFDEGIVEEDDGTKSTSKYKYALAEKYINEEEKRFSVISIPQKFHSNVIGEIKFNKNEFVAESTAESEELLRGFTFLRADKWRFPYQNLLRNRRRWWKKVMFNPSSVYVPEEKSIKLGSDYPRARIFANFEAQDYDFKSDFNLESIEVLGEENNFKICKSEVCHKTGILTHLLDAVRVRMFLKTTRLALDQSVAPFQSAVLILSNSEDRPKKPLEDLRKFVIDKLKARGITVYEEAENLEQTDLFGVPFVIFLNPRSLEDGIVNIWDRESTWYEQIHLADIIQRFVKIYQNKDIPNLLEELNSL